MKAWKTAVGSSLATGALMLVLLAPAAESGSKPGLKMVTAQDEGNAGTFTAKCPKGYSVTGGGYLVEGGLVVTDVEKSAPRKYRVSSEFPSNKRRGGLTGAQAICVKGTGGLEITDLGQGMVFKR